VDRLEGREAALADEGLGGSLTQPANVIEAEAEGEFGLFFIPETQGYGVSGLPDVLCVGICPERSRTVTGQ